MDPGDVLWRVLGFGRQEVPPGAPYWFDNRTRRPAGVVYLQHSLTPGLSLESAAGTVEVPAGSFVLFRHGEDTRYGRRDGKRPYACAWVGLMGAGLEAHWQVAQARYGAVLPADPGLAQALDRVIALAGLGQHGQPANQGAEAGVVALATAVHGLVTHLFATGEARLRRTHSPVEAAIDDLLSAPYHARTLQAVARAHGCSREHLARAFLARLGSPPATWLAQTRLARARDLHRLTALPLAAIAQQSGFPSAQALGRALKRTAAG